MKYKFLKTYDELDFTSDYLFCRILETNEDLCRQLLELIIGRKVQKIVYASKQETLDVSYDKKGVRLDVYLEDSDKAHSRRSACGEAARRMEERIHDTTHERSGMRREGN